MIRIQPSRFLRRVLRAGAAGNILAGSAAILLTAPLAEWLRLPEPVLVLAGLYLVAHAGLGLWLASRAVLAEAAVWLLMGFNAAFAFASIVLLALAILTPNLPGVLVVCAEAWVALALVELQHLGLLRSVRRPLPGTLGIRLGPQS